MWCLPAWGPLLRRRKHTTGGGYSVSFECRDCCGMYLRSTPSLLSICSCSEHSRGVLAPAALSALLPSLSLIEVVPQATRNGMCYSLHHSQILDFQTLKNGANFKQSLEICGCFTVLIAFVPNQQPCIPCLNFPEQRDQKGWECI